MSSNETTLKCKPKRYLWVDNLKIFACLLVVIGHLYMSMMAGGWISENNILYCWPIQTVYTFHVPLFFVCSGFLYQATAPNEWNVKKHIGNIKKKALALGVPYVTFSTITLLLKNVFATDVNNAAPPFLKTLLIEPIAPYWYLYTLFLLFCLIPPVIGKGKRSPAVADAIVRNGAVYFAAIGGAGALLSKCILSSEVIAYGDLGPEAVRKLEVKDFPVVVVIDSQGNNLYETAARAYAKEG